MLFISVFRNRYNKLKPCSSKRQAKLSASGDEAWKEREAAVLTLGAIAEGCFNGLYPLLSEASPFLILNHLIYLIFLHPVQVL